MVRKQVYIGPEQGQILKQRAKDLGVSEAELRRRGIERIAHVPSVLYVDKRAWRDELEFIKKRASEQEALGGKRTWTREELYNKSSFSVTPKPGASEGEI